MLFIGVPIGFSIAGTSSMGIFISDVPIDVIAQQLSLGVESFVFIAIPLFIFAAELMARGGKSKRLIDVSNAIVGHLPGGLAIVSILSCMFFAAITGSAVAATAAIGSVMIPLMKSKGYNIKFTAPLL